MKNFLLKWYPLLIILLLALTLRINLLLHRGTLWFDEHYSVYFSSIPSWADTWKYWLLENNPPFYHIILRFYFNFIDKNNEFMLRIPSIVFGLITIALLYIYAQKIFSKHAAILSSLFLTLTTTHIRYSTEVRMYSLLTMLTIISTMLFDKIFFKKKYTKLWWSLYTILTIILLYTHLTAATIIVIHLVTLIYIKSNKKIIKQWLISQTIAVMVWSVWLIPVVISRLTPDLTDAWFFSEEHFTNQTIINSLVKPFIELKVSNYFLTTTLIFLIFFVVHLLHQKTKNSSQEIKNYIFFFSILGLLPITCASFMGIFLSQYFIFSYIGLFLLVAYIIDEYTHDSQKKYKMALLLITIIMLPQAITFSQKTIFNWLPFVEHIKKHETPHSITLISYVDGFTFKQYYDNNSPIVSIYTRQDNLSNEERIIRYNWNKHNIISNDDAKKWLFEKIKENGANKIFLILGSNTINDFHYMLFEAGWSLKNKTQLPGQMSHILLEFDAPNAGECKNK